MLAMSSETERVKQVVELYQNQRNRPFKGWSSRYLLRSDPGRYSDHLGGGEREKLDFRPPAGWAWADDDTGWEVDKTYTSCDEEGWTYATSFSDFTSANPGLPVPAEHGTRVRRRRFTRCRVMINEEAVAATHRAGGIIYYGDDASDGGAGGGGGVGGRGISIGSGSVGSRGSRRLTGRASVGFALAPLEEASLKKTQIEVVIHGESFIVSAGVNDIVTWVQEEAAALFSREHNFSTHLVQVIELYPRDIFQAGVGTEEDDALRPLPAESLVKEAISTRDRKIVHPAPMEDGMTGGVPDARVWARVQATVTVPPGPLGVELDGEVGDRPVVLEVQGQSGPGIMTASAPESALSRGGLPPTPKSKATPSVGPKLSRKDRAKRLLLNLAAKHHPNQNQRATYRSNLSTPRGAVGSGGGFNDASTAVPSPVGRGGQAVVSPLVTATDSATVRPGMVLASVAARSGQGVSQEAVNTLGMGVKEAIETLVRYQHLHRSITFVDPQPGFSANKDVLGGGAVSAGVTCPFSVSVTVVEAKGLKRSDLFTADPFAWVRLGGSSHKTAVCRSTSRPHWGETFKFMILSLERSLVVQLWDADELGADVNLGEITVNLGSLPVNNPFSPDSSVVDTWYNLQGPSRSVRLKIRIDQQLYVAIHKKKVDSAARLLQSAMRSFVFRRQTLSKRPSPPRRDTSGGGGGPDAAQAVFDTVDAAGGGRGDRHGGAGTVALRGGMNLARKSSSRKSVAGAVGGGWEASGAHAASTLADVFPPDEGEDEDEDESFGLAGRQLGGRAKKGSGDTPKSGTGTNGVSRLVTKFLEGPALERFGGGGIHGGNGGTSGILSRKSSVGTLGGRRSTVSFVATASTGRKSSGAASVRFIEGGRRSTVGGWGEKDEAARPGASVCKDCLSDVASLLAVAMAPVRAAKTAMEDATHLRYPTTLADAPPPLAVAAFPTPRGGFGPLTVTSCAAFAPLREDNWADHAAPVLVAPSTEAAANIAVAAGEVWDRAMRVFGAGGVGVSSGGGVGGKLGGVVGGVVGVTGGGSGAATTGAMFASKASVTVVLKEGGYVSLVPGEEFQYWRWASALCLAVSGVSSMGKEGRKRTQEYDSDGNDEEALRGVVKELRASSTRGGAGGSPYPVSTAVEKNADAVCTLINEPQGGALSWSKSAMSPADDIPLSSVKGLVLSHSHPEACKFLFTVTVVSGCLNGIADGVSSWAGGRLQSYCRVEAGGEKSRTKVATGGTPFWNHRCTFAVSEAEALSPGGGARICCLSHRVAYQDTQIGESFIPFSALTSGKDYTETLDISGNLRRLRLMLHSAKGLVSRDVTGVTDPYCIIVPVRHDGTEVTSERGETSWRRAGLRPEEWEEAFELCKWVAPEEVKGIKVALMDRDMGRKDEPLGEVFIPISSFKASKAKRTKVGLKVKPPPPSSSRYSKTLGKYNISKLGIKNTLSPTSSGVTGFSDKDAQNLGTLCVSMSVIETEPPDPATSGGGIPPGGVKIRCSLDIADEFTCAWPSLLLRHGARGGGDGAEGAEGEAGLRGGGEVERWRVAAGFGGLVLSPVASGEGAAADSSPFIRMDPSGPADGFMMEVYENQRKKQPWGWGSGRKRHLRTSDPGRFSDSKGENRLHLKLLDQAEVPAGWAWNAPEWTVAGGDCPRDKEGWTYGKDASFEPLLLDPASGVSKEQKGTAVRRRRWVRPLHRTGVGAPTVPPRPAASHGAGTAAVDIPEGLVPFCKAQPGGGVMVLVHENQRYQPGAGWGSSDEDHLLPEDRAPLTGESGIYPIDDLDDISPSTLGPSYRWEGEEDEEGEWNAGPWTYAERFDSLPAELPRTGSITSESSIRNSGGPSTPPPPPPDRPAGVRSRVWWRAMVRVADDAGNMSRGTSGASSLSAGGGGRRDSTGMLVGKTPSRRKVPHTALTPYLSAGKGGSAVGARGGGGDRRRVPLDCLKRVAVVGPSTLIIELKVEAKGIVATSDAAAEWQAATLIVGPCDAPRLGSLLIERAATAAPRAVLGQVVRRARKLAVGPPPLPPRPSRKALGSNGGRDDSGSPKPGGWQSDPGRQNNPHRSDDSSNRFISDHGGSPHASEARPLSSANPFGSGDSTKAPTLPPRSTKSSVSSGADRNACGSAGNPPATPPRPVVKPADSKNPFGSGEGEAPPRIPPRPIVTTAMSPGRGRADRVEPKAEADLLDNVVSDGIFLLQQAGRAVAALDDAYNAAYNASSVADGWGGDGHDAAELGEAVLWTLWSRLVRFQGYLRQLLADTPAQTLKLSAAVKKGDWGALVASMETEAAQQRSSVPLTNRKANIEGDGVESGSDEDGTDEQQESGMEGSMRAVEGLCNALDRRVTEMLLCADTLPEGTLRKAVEVLATQCYTKVVDEVGRHITFRYEGVLPLSDQDLLALLDILVNKADLIERTLQPRLDLVGWRAVPPPLLTKAISVPWLLAMYATSIESKLSGLFRNILDTNQEVLDFPVEADQGPSPEKAAVASAPKSPLRNRFKRGGGGGRDSTGRGTPAQQKSGFTMWMLHDDTAKPLSVVPTTAMTLVDTYVVTVAKTFPDDAAVQAVILRAGAGALGSLRNTISAHAEAAVSSCPERGWDKLLRYLCATANDCWQLVADAVPSIEERHPRAMAEGAEEAYETLKQLWMLLGVSCTRKAARLVLGFMEADGLFALQGMHEVGAEQSLVEIREALEYYCIKFLRPWLQEYFYQKVLVRLCDHIVVWAAQGLVRAAAAGNPPLDQGHLLRLKACRDTLSEALDACSAEGHGEGGGMYERRLGFLDDVIELLTVPGSALEGVFTGMLQQHIHCQRSVQHALQVVLSLRADGSAVHEAVSKWADESNWMGGDAVVLTADIAEIEPFHRVFRRPLSALRADPNPLVAPTVFARASDSWRQSHASRQPSLGTAGGASTESGGGGAGGVGSFTWSKRSFTFPGGGVGGTGSNRKRGMREAMAKFKKGRRFGSRTSEGNAAAVAADAVVMTGVGAADGEPQTVLRVTILEAEGLRNVAVLKKTDSYVTAHLSTRTGIREGRTSIKTNTCDPKWNEPISFTVPTGTLVDAQLFLRVVGKQKFRDDISLGRIELPLAGITNSGTADAGGGQTHGAEGGRWFQLGDGQGRLKIGADLVTRRPSLIV